MIDGSYSLLLQTIGTIVTAAATTYASTPSSLDIIESSSASSFAALTHENATSPSTLSARPKELYSNKYNFLFGGLVMLLGVIGNSLALRILSRKQATKNSKYTLMLRCLATNNLIALLGMISNLLLGLYLPKSVYQAHMKLNCASLVVWRFFGLSSGCIAAVMAIERWMALARPFIYHKHITYELIRKIIHSLVFIAVIVTFLPFIGFGAYIDESNPSNRKCIRYRDAEGFWNKTYSVVFMIFGSVLCIVIVACNLFLARVLCFIGRTRTTKRHMHYDMINREKGSNNNHRIDNDSNSGSSLCGQTQYQHNNGPAMKADTSPEEIKFAKLMTILSISFVICWMPQMIAIPMAIIPNRVPKNHTFFIFADVLMALHFTSDPYVYVISRTKQSYILGCFKSLRGGLRRTQSEQSEQSRLRTVVVESTLDCPLN